MLFYFYLCEIEIEFIDKTTEKPLTITHNDGFKNKVFKVLTTQGIISIPVDESINKELSLFQTIIL